MDALFDRIPTYSITKKSDNMKSIIKNVSIICLVIVMSFAVLTGCKKTSDLMEYVSSYDEIRERLSDKKGMLFPDLSRFRFNELNTKYRLEYTFYDENAEYKWEYISKDGMRSECSGYVVFGDSTCGDLPVYTTLICHEFNEYRRITDPINYEGEQIEALSGQSEAARHETYRVVLDGYWYEAGMIYDKGLTLTDEEAAEAKQCVCETLYSFMCDLVDAAHQNNG